MFKNIILGKYPEEINLSNSGFKYWTDKDLNNLPVSKTQTSRVNPICSTGFLWVVCPKSEYERLKSFLRNLHIQNCPLISLEEVEKGDKIVRANKDYEKDWLQVNHKKNVLFCCNQIGEKVKIPITSEKEWKRYE